MTAKSVASDHSEFIGGLPKAELHVHVEGTLEPELAFALAGRNGVRLPFRSVGALREAYRFGNLQGFLDLYYLVQQVLVAEQDFHDLAMAYLERAVQDGVSHAEIMFDPQAHVARGVPFAAVFEGIWAALVTARREFGISTQLIMCFLRDRDPDEAMAVLNAAEPYMDRIAAVGLDSAEVGNPPARFAKVFEVARAAGLKAVAHAGEEGPPAYITEALDTLGVVRIDHGVRAVEDAGVMERLARDRIPLTVCPLSNVCLGVTPDMTSHPLRRLMDGGVLVTVNSDDPAYFGGHVNANYTALQDAFCFDREELAGLARASFAASFLDKSEKAARIAGIDAYVSAAESKAE